MPSGVPVFHILLPTKRNADRAPGLHHIQCRCQHPIHAVERKLHDGVAVLVGHIAFPVRPEAEEAGGFAQAGSEAHGAQIPGGRIDAIHRHQVRVAVGDQHVLTGGVHHHLAGVGVAGDGLGHGGELLERGELSGVLVELEVEDLVALLLAHVHPAVVGVHGRVSGLIPGAGQETVGLGERPGLGIVRQGAHLPVAVPAPLGAGEEVAALPVPEALVDGGDFSLLLALVGEGGDHGAQGAVVGPEDGVEGSALEGGHDHVAVGGVHGDVHRVLAADVDGV